MNSTFEHTQFRLLIELKEEFHSCVDLKHRFRVHTPRDAEAGIIDALFKYQSKNES